MNYYCLIAGLPDIQAEDSKASVSVSGLKTDLLEQLSVADSQLLKLIFAQYDNSNLLAYLNNKEAKLDPLGNLSAEDWADLLLIMQESENSKDARLHAYIQQFYSTQNREKISLDDISPEDYLSTLYYEEAMHCKNKFLQSWFEFNLNINNILTAVTCRKHGFDQHKMIIGNNEIAMALRQSNARDFGLAGAFSELEMLLRIADDANLLEREKKIDALKWQWLEENTFFHYFSVEKVLAFVLKVQMLDRWKMLSVDKGAQIFRDLLATMKEGVQFEELLS